MRNAGNARLRCGGMLPDARHGRFVVRCSIQLSYGRGLRSRVLSGSHDRGQGPPYWWKKHDRAGGGAADAVANAKDARAYFTRNCCSITVLAPPNPLRSVSGDAAYIASVITQIPGPVLLVGHSYGGMVITNAVERAPNVVGLVYICAFIPEVGESIQSLASNATDSLLGLALRPMPVVREKMFQHGEQPCSEPPALRVHVSKRCALN